MEGTEMGVKREEVKDLNKKNRKPRENGRWLGRK